MKCTRLCKIFEIQIKNVYVNSHLANLIHLNDTVVLITCRLYWFLSIAYSYIFHECIRFPSSQIVYNREGNPLAAANVAYILTMIKTIVELMFIMYFMLAVNKTYFIYLFIYYVGLVLIQVPHINMKTIFLQSCLWAHLMDGHVSYCHYLLSVAVGSFFFSSSLTLLDHLDQTWNKCSFRYLS